MEVNYVTPLKISLANSDDRRSINLKRTSVIVILVSIVFLFIVSCNPSTTQENRDGKTIIQTVEVTRRVPETVVVNQPVLVTVFVTQIVTTVVTSTPTVIPRPTITVQSSSGVDPSANPDTAIVQYYTLLDQGQYEEAYHLLSASHRYSVSLDQYVEGAELSFKKVAIYDVQPYNTWAAENGYALVEDTETEKHFVVELAAWGEGNMSGSVQNGRLQGIFIKVVEEEDGWKIFTLDTAPPRP